MSHHHTYYVTSSYTHRIKADSLREIFNSLVVESDLVKGDAAVVQRVCVVLVQLQHLQNVYRMCSLIRMCTECVLL